jgi:hypothetical protein
MWCEQGREPTIRATQYGTRRREPKGGFGVLPEYLSRQGEEVAAGIRGGWECLGEATTSSNGGYCD